MESHKHTENTIYNLHGEPINVPDNYICPISLEIMADPVHFVSQDGQLSPYAVDYNSAVGFLNANSNQTTTATPKLVDPLGKMFIEISSENEKEKRQTIRAPLKFEVIPDEELKKEIKIFCEKNEIALSVSPRLELNTPVNVASQHSDTPIFDQARNMKIILIGSQASDKNLFLQYLASRFQSSHLPIHASVSLNQLHLDFSFHDTWLPNKFRNLSPNSFKDADAIFIFVTTDDQIIEASEFFNKIRGTHLPNSARVFLMDSNEELLDLDNLSLFISHTNFKTLAYDPGNFESVLSRVVASEDTKDLMLLHMLKRAVLVTYQHNLSANSLFDHNEDQVFINKFIREVEHSSTSVEAINIIQAFLSGNTLNLVEPSEGLLNAYKNKLRLTFSSEQILSELVSVSNPSSVLSINTPQ